MASDDRRIHWVTDEIGGSWTWLEETDSYYAVASEVLQILAEINEWLETLADPDRGVPKELLFWVQHAEGGYTTQRIQDVLLLVRTYTRVLQEAGPSRLTVIHDQDRVWESTVLAACAAAADIPITFVGGAQVAVLVERFLGGWLNIALRMPYAFLIWIAAHFRAIGRKRLKGKEDILIQVCDSRPKAIRYVEILLSKFEERSAKVGVLCWGAPSGAAQLRSSGFRADDLELWVRPTDFLQGLLRARYTWRAASSSRMKFMTLPTLKQYGVALGPLLWPSVAFFIKARLASRYHLMVGAKRYFQSFTPRIMRFWTTILPQGVIAYRSIEEGSKPLVFHSPGFPYNHFNPYECRSIPVDLELAQGEEHRSLLQNDSFPPRQIVTVGHDRSETALAFRSRHSQEDSRKALKLPLSAQLTLLYEVGYVLHGHLSPKDQIITTDTVLDLAREQPKLSVLIKPHPSYRRGILYAQVEAAALPNVVLVESTALPYHSINAADVVLTKISTVGIEAMYLDRPVISLLLDGEPRNQLLGTGAEYITSCRDLSHLIMRLMEPGFLTEWSRERGVGAREHLSQSTFLSDQTPAELTAEAVLDMLNGPHRHSAEFRND